ncbi:MAG: lysozyme [Burkholderiaceae bacterium]|nr:lysozyme [Burkholderiaceae bacterium]
MNNRLMLASLSLSAAALVGIAVHEGYRETAYIPVPGDVPTIGFGDTHNVKLGDRTDPVRALIKLSAHTENFQKDLKRCIGDIPLHQHEWDAIVSWAYNVGTGAACKSTLVKKLKARDYRGACTEILKWDKFNNKPLRGLTIRRQQEYRLCMGGSDA